MDRFRIRFILFYLILFALFCSAITLADQAEKNQIVGRQFVTYLDGRCEISVLVQNSRTGRLKAISPSQQKPVAPSEDWEPLLVDHISRWRPGSELLVGLTPYAVQFKRRFREIMNEFYNTRRGTPMAPKITITDRVDEYLPEDWVELARDGKCTIVMTEDDRFLPEGCLARASFVADSDTRELYDGDAYFRSNHFSMFDPDDDQYGYRKFYRDERKIVVHEFGHCLGYLHPTWDCCIMLGTNISDVTFEDERSIVWKLWKSRNRLYYDDGFRSAPRLSPVNGSVIDLTDAIAPSYVEEENRIYYLTDLALTNLKGIPGKPLTLKIYKGWIGPQLSLLGKGSAGTTVKSSPENSNCYTNNWTTSEQPILTLTGSTRTRVYGSNAIPTYRGSRLKIGYESDVETLVQLLIDEGREYTVNGIYYKCALKVTLIVKGYMKINSDVKSTVIRHVYFAAPYMLYERGYQTGEVKSSGVRQGNCDALHAPPLRDH